MRQKHKITVVLAATLGKNDLQLTCSTTADMFPGNLLRPDVFYNMRAEKVALPPFAKN